MFATDRIVTTKALNKLAIVVFCCAVTELAAQEDAGEPDLFTLKFALVPQAAEPKLRPSGVDVATAELATSEDDAVIESVFAAIAELERTIESAIAAQGTQAVVLVDHYRSLAELHRTIGNYGLALAALDQARDIIRRSQGLHSLDQAALLLEAIDGLEAAGAFLESDELQDDLLLLANRDENAADPRAPAMLAAVAERQFAVVEAYQERQIYMRTRNDFEGTEGSGWEPSTSKAGRERSLTALNVIADRFDALLDDGRLADAVRDKDLLAPVGDVAEIYRWVDTANDLFEVGPLPRMERTGLTWEQASLVSDREFASAALYRARRLFSAAMQLAFRQGAEAEYRALEARLIETYYLEQSNLDLMAVAYTGDADNPIESLLRARVIERIEGGSPPADVARELVALGDGLRNQRALDRYQQAYDYLLAQDAGAEVITALFNPEAPAIRRAFGPEQYIPYDAQAGYRGFIDVLVETGKFGHVTDVDILSASAGTTRAIERRLQTHVAQSWFRPRFVDGAPVRSDQFALRFAYDFAWKR